MNVLHRIAALTAIFSLTLLCMGMGDFGDTEIVKKIPRPDRPFTVTIVDDTDTSFMVSDFSVEGLTLVPVQMGKANMSIDFAKVKTVTLFEQDSKLAATVVLNDGSTKQVTMSPRTMFFGRTTWGLMRLKAGDIKAIHF
ncbi:MAG: hypothetical protein KKE73_07860 [Proteobacteria bacterium]|nr:hypothetical protein [Pseudomonadota bacterium]